MSFTPSFACSREEALEAFESMLHATRDELELREQITAILLLPDVERRQALLVAVTQMRAARASTARTCALWMLNEPECRVAAWNYLNRVEKLWPHLAWCGAILTLAAALYLMR